MTDIECVHNWGAKNSNGTFCILCGARRTASGQIDRRYLPRPVSNRSPKREIARSLKDSGMTYAAIAVEMGVTRQRVQNLVSPTDKEKREIIKGAGGKCSRCRSSEKLHIHHNDYSDDPEIEVLCVACHRRAEKKPPKPKVYKKLHAGNTSGYRGIVFHKPTRKWCAKINANGAVKTSKYFASEIDAAKAYDEMARHYKGDKAILNFDS
jgi:hypothetical protein